MKHVFLLFLASIAILFLILQQWVGIYNVGKVLLSINFIYLPLVILLPFLIILIYSIRWRLLLRSVDIDTDLRIVFKHAFIGAAINNLTPMIRFGGEPVKCYMLSKEIDVPKKRVLASLAMDSLITAVTLVGLIYFGAVSLFMLNVLDFLVLWSILSIAILPLFFGVYVIYNKRLLASLSKKVARMFSRFWPKASSELPEDAMLFRENLKLSLKRRGIMLKALILGVIERFLEILCLYVIFLSLGIDLGLYSSAMVLGVGVLAGMIPLFPGGLVTYESSAIFVLGVLGISTPLAATAILLWRGVYYWMITLVGVSFGWFHGAKSVLKRI